MRIADGIAVVTGASSGIGAAVAVRLAAEGARLVLVGRDPERLKTVAARTGGKAVVADLGTGAGIDAVCGAVAGTGVALLVHAAGLGAAGPVDALDAGATAELLAVNLAAPIDLTRRLLPGLRETGGHLVFVASIAALGVANEAVYSATKAGLRGFADAVRIEVPRVGVTTVLPGAVDTDFFRRRGVPYDRRFPRPVSAERVADAVVHGVLKNRTEVVVPRWLTLGSRVHGAAPALFARLSRAFG
ncbi:MAG TPA: SDR family NAD(P)-dependent oxidoreductase [Pseudonocardia sp.]|jgi:hypothetical protein|nr:SDR family NAD(P)-dependent oxidoreductase [Pseudonocardia sp.]